MDDKTIRSLNGIRDAGRGSYYKELLPCGCYFTAEGGQAYVSYDFAGNYGKVKREYKIPIDQLDTFLDYLHRNLVIYLHTKESIGKVAMSYEGYGGMTLQFNTSCSGVCVEGYYFPVDSMEQFHLYEISFERAKKLYAHLQTEDQGNG